MKKIFLIGSSILFLSLFVYLFFDLDCYNYEPSRIEIELINDINSLNEKVELKIDECIPFYWELYLDDMSENEINSISIVVFERIELIKNKKDFRLRIFKESHFLFLLGRYGDDIQKRDFYCLEC